MEFYTNYYEAGCAISTKTGQDEFFGALIRYLFEGVEPAKFRSSEARVAFQAVKPSREKQWNGRRSKLKNGRGDEEGDGEEGEDKPEATAKEGRSKREANGKETASNGEGKRKQTGRNAKEANKLISYKANKLSRDDIPPNPPSDFPWLCLDSLNRLMGTTYSSMPARCTDTLERFSGKYALNDVESMIAYKRDEWQGTKYANCLTPNTLFSPDHFEQYIHQSQQKEASHGRSAKYAD